MSQIIWDLVCIVIFYPSLCVFQDIHTRQILGYSVNRGKLYYLDLINSGEHQLCHSGHALWLFHHHLGHLSFSYIKKLQPYLFLIISDSFFHYSVYEIAKSHRISYYPSLNQSFISFMKIHFDI